MRHILVDHARRRQRAKRGSGAVNVELIETAALLEEQAEHVVALNEALERLAQLDQRASQVVELKYFGGMTYDERYAKTLTQEISKCELTSDRAN